MNPLFDPVTWEEFELVRSHFESKAEALRKKVKKDFAWTGYDISKYSKIYIGENIYIIAAGNVFSAIINDVLLKAIESYPEVFGKQDPIKVLRAVYDSEPWGSFSKFETFLSLEVFAFIFEMADKNVINDRVLRVDLFRFISKEENNGKNPEFTGGLFHVFKHFSFKGTPLSTGPGEIEIYHPRSIFTILINCFFRSSWKYTKDGFTSRFSFGDGIGIKAAFYNEEGTGIYFIKTIHPC